MRFFSKLEKIVTGLGATLLFLLMIMTFADVVGRDFFNSPLSGGVELTEIVLALMVFVLLPSVSLGQEHITVDLIDPIAGKFLNALRNVLTSGIGIVFFGIVSWRMWILATRAAGYNDVTPSLRLPIAPVLFVVSVFAGVTALVYLYLLLRPRARTESAELESARKLADTAQ